MLHLLLLISLGFFLQLAEAQSFTVPSKWRKPTTTLSRQDRLTLVNGLLDTVHPALNTTTGMFQGLSVPQTANMLCALSIGDRISNSTSSKDVVLQSLNTTFGRAPNIVTLRSPQLNSDAAVWGLAAIYSYKAYNDQSSLRFAQSMWAQVNRYMVTTDDATAGSHPEKTAAFPSTCNGASNAGAVFYIANNVNNTVVNSETVGTFLALSAYLYEQTQNVQYLSAAELSASFVTTVLYDGNAIRDGITLGTCDTVNDFWTSNSGVVIEGLSILASTHSTYTSRLNSLISATIPYSRWTNVSDGIIIEGPTSAADANSNGATFGYKAILVRGLYEAYSRIPSNSTEASFIQSFITVQLNALTDLSSVTGSNLYSPKWEGPPPTQLLPWGQLAAVDVLNAAVGLAEDARYDLHAITLL
ncbi:hypothetical protein BDY19DRAFT_992295 [Irpex rosettiformis]|uniref:Uncharacterized protein n=1 Tax=Irpex rosettiformis TaxID=378272 RepID=A0ACB8U710_9APHY|nr:hypothetical protein BDY19DRAFT_992295 [Irpex rosettiformis]